MGGRKRKIHQKNGRHGKNIGGIGKKKGMDWGALQERGKSRGEQKKRMWLVPSLQ